MRIPKLTEVFLVEMGFSYQAAQQAAKKLGKPDEAAMLAAQAKDSKETFISWDDFQRKHPQQAKGFEEALVGDTDPATMEGGLPVDFVFTKFGDNVFNGSWKHGQDLSSGTLIDGKWCWEDDKRTWMYVDAIEVLENMLGGKGRRMLSIGDEN